MMPVRTSVRTFTTTREPLQPLRPTQVAPPPATTTQTQITAQTLTPAPTPAPAQAVQHPTRTLADVGGLVEELVTGLLGEELFNGHVQAIRQWQAAMNPNDLMDLTTPEGLKKASVALCYLLHKVIKPVLAANQHNRDLSKRVSALAKKCMAILEITCPNEDLRKAWIKEYPTLADKRLAKKEQIEKVIAAYALLEQQLIQMTQLNLNSLVEVFEELKAKLIALNAGQTLYAEAMQTQLRALSLRMAQLSTQLSEHATAAAATQTDLINYKQNLLTTVKQMRNLAHEVMS